MSGTIPARTMELLAMLRYKRPSGGTTENAFIAKYLAPLPGVTRDSAGNIWCRVGQDSPILWSSHTDTVHKSEGFQLILYGAGMASADNNGGECLGADCTTGVWIMRNMILAGVPGTYVFHAGEEVGGIGSSHIAKNREKDLARFKYAVAFDRKGDDEVITHQGFERTASNAFARSFAAALRLPQLAPSDGGTFTDTANYSQIIPECTNIAVGYYGQHTPREYQDVEFAVTLLDAILAADFSLLACERDPAAYEPSLAWWEKDSPDYDRDRDFGDDGPATGLAAYVRRYPNNVADFLEMMNVDVAEIEQCLFGTTGPIDVVGGHQ